MVKIEAIKLEITSEQKKGSDDKNVTDRTVMEGKLGVGDDE